MPSNMELFKFGNLKIGKDTIIFNMGAATSCPSAKIGLCNAINSGAKCYALKAENFYGEAVIKYRNRQFNFWRKNEAKTIARIIIAKINNAKNTEDIKYFRFNESGDFWDQLDVVKLSKIAEMLKPFGITTYGHTSRKDLSFNDVHFLVKGSGFTKKEARGINGRSIIISKNDEVPEDFVECKMDCTKCNLCFNEKIKVDIAFRKH